MTETIVLVLGFAFILCMSNMICFFIGARTGQKVVNRESLKILSPIKKIEEHKREKEEKYELERQAVLFENIDNYDGTSYGQKDVPKARD